MTKIYSWLSQTSRHFFVCNWWFSFVYRKYHIRKFTVPPIDAQKEKQKGISIFFNPNLLKGFPMGMLRGCEFRLKSNNVIFLKRSS